MLFSTATVPHGLDRDGRPSTEICSVFSQRPIIQPAMDGLHSSRPCVEVPVGFWLLRRLFSQFTDSTADAPHRHHQILRGHVWDTISDKAVTTTFAGTVGLHSDIHGVHVPPRLLPL
jgi:hypothetical protein